MRTTPVSLVVFFASQFLAIVLAAQSSVVSDAAEPVFSNRVSGVNLVNDFADVVPNSMNSVQRRYETILRRVAPSIDDLPQSTAHLLEKLQELGLPVSLNGSAEGDIQEDTDIAIPFPELPLITRLKRGLTRHNCQLEIVQDEVMIVSLDVVGDPEYFLTVSYDISRLPFSTYELIQTVQSSLTPDDWSDTGTGDQTLVVLSSPSRRTLVFGGPYTNHLQLREFFNGLGRINALSSQPDSFANSESRKGSSNSMLHSRVVQVPKSGTERRGITRPNGGNQGGFGGGGTAGGVFRIGN